MKYLFSLAFAIVLSSSSICLAQNEGVSLSPIRGTNFGSISSTPSLMSTSEGIYFVTNDESTEAVIVWRMELDGKNLREIFTLPVSSIDPSGGVSGGPGTIVQLGNKVMFAILDGLYSYDLATKSVVKLFDFDSTDPMGVNVSELVQVGNQVFFADGDPSDTSIWKTSGTIETTQLVKKLPFSDGGFISSSASELTAYNNKLYFKYNDGLTGDELWVSDGTETGTSLFIDIDTGIGCGGPCSSGPRNLLVMNGELIFDTAAAFNAGRSEIWKTDGTTSGTEPFFDLDGASGQTYLSFNGKLLIASGSDFNLNELWSIDNTSSFSQRLAQLYPTSNSINQNFSESAVVYDGKAYFGFTTPDVNGIEGALYDIWETDGTTSGSGIVMTRIKPANAYSLNVQGLIAFSSGVVFTEQVCSGNMMGSTCSTSLNLYDNSNVVKSLLSFPDSENVYIHQESILTTNDNIFVAIVKNQKLIIYSSVLNEDFIITPIIDLLLD